MCDGSKLNNSLGRTKLNYSQGKQQLELSARTWSGCVPWNHGKFVCQSARWQRVSVVKRGFSLEEAFTTQEKGFIIIFAKHIRLTKRKIWTFCVLKLLIWCQKWVACIWQLTLQPLSAGRKIVLSFATKYVVPRQIKSRILELSSKKIQNGLTSMFPFASPWGILRVLEKQNSLFLLGPFI